MSFFSDESFSDASCNTYLPLKTSIQDITQKLHLTGIKPALASATENTFSSNINIYTDDTAVTYAEEATASPSDVTAQKKFDDIGKQQFNEDIIFKKKKSGRKRSAMTASTTSISSNSSEEFGNNHFPIKTVEMLSNDQSKNFITQEIESKEKLLAGILRLNEVKIPEVVEYITDGKDNKQNEAESSFIPDFKLNYRTVETEIDTTISNSPVKEKMFPGILKSPIDAIESVSINKQDNQYSNIPEFKSDEKIESRVYTSNKQQDIKPICISNFKTVPEKFGINTVNSDIQVFEDKNKSNFRLKPAQATSTKQWSSSQTEPVTHCDILPSKYDIFN